MGDFHRARKNYERALIIKKSKMSKDSPEIAQTLSNIGNLNPLSPSPIPSNHLNPNRKYMQEHE